MDRIIQSGENGIIYTAGNQKELIECLLKLKDKNLREKLSEILEDWDKWRIKNREEGDPENERITKKSTKTGK